MEKNRIPGRTIRDTRFYCSSSVKWKNVCSKFKPRQKNKMKNKLVIATTFLLLVYALQLFSQDWPQFLGPDRSSTSPQKGILRAWPESGPKVLWTASIGIGYGGSVVKDGKVFLLDRDDKGSDNMRCFDLSSGNELGAVMIQAGKMEDGKYGKKEFFRTEEFGAHTKPAILYNGYFYSQYGTNSRRDGLVCMSMDGQIMWKTKCSPSFDKGSMILVDGLLLSTDGATKLYLIEPEPSAFRPLASVELLEKGNGNPSGIGGATQNWAPIALADGKLLLRDQSKLICVKVAQ